MSQNAQPQFRRMPGSVILTIVFLGLVALIMIRGGMVLLSVSAPLGVVVMAAGVFNAVLAIGIGNHMRWAAITTTVWSGVVIVVWLIAIAPQPSTDPVGAVGTPGLYAFVGIFVTRKYTREWCHRRGGRRSGFLSIDRPAEEEEVLTYNDQVELIGHLDEYGLRAGSVGTIVDVHDDPESFEVEFADDRTETTTLVTLPPDQLRFIAAPR